MIDATGASTVCPFSFSRYGTGKFIMVTWYLLNKWIFDVEILDFFHDTVKHMGMAVMATC